LWTLSIDERDPEDDTEDHTGPYACTLCDYRAAHKPHLTRHLKTHPEGRPFPCTLCKYRAAQNSTLTAHMRTHTGEKPFVCTRCDFRAAHKSSLATHMKNHTGEKPYACDEADDSEPLTETFYFGDSESDCGRLSIDESGPEDHTRPHACTLCDFRAAHKSHLTRHLKTHPEERPFPCTLCKYRAAQKSTLTAHMRTHTGEKQTGVMPALELPLACLVCGFRTARKSSLTDHIKTHFPDNSDSSEQEDIEAAWQDAIEPLPATYGCIGGPDCTHNSELPLACLVCGFRTARKSSLTDHMKTHSDSSEQEDIEAAWQDDIERLPATYGCIGGQPAHPSKPFVCTLCEYRTASKSDFTAHQKKHMGEKPFACTVCEFRTAGKSSITNHMKTHTREKPYACDEADEHSSCLTEPLPETLYFADSESDYGVLDESEIGGPPPHPSKNADAALENIDLTQAGLMPFACIICEFRTPHKSSLARHMMTHTGEKPHACTLCEYRTARKTHLTRHMKTHTREPFVCTLCDYRTITTSHLTRHMKTHTGEKLFSCTVCDYTTANKSHHRRHTRGHMDHPAAADGSAAATGEESQCADHPAAADSSVAAAAEEESHCADPTTTSCTSCGDRHDQCLCEDAVCIGDFLFLSRKRNDGPCTMQL
jgi:KRAB domain-containing zinc finger protein